MKKINIIALTLLTCTVLGSTAFAANNIPQNSNISNTQVQRRVYCPMCDSILPMLKVCLSDTREFAGVREHKCGFLLQDTCTITTYNAKAGNYCDFCGRFEPFTDEERPDGFAQHGCLEIHTKCGAGDNGYYVICPFGG